MEKIDKNNIENILALTPMQEGMLFHYLKKPGSDFYFEQLSLDIIGQIDLPLFEQTWNRVIKKNEMLRTVFRWEKMKAPSQIVLKQYCFKPTYIDLSGKKGIKKQNALEEVKKNDRKQKFDLTRVPFRITLCKLGKDKFVMIISNHHILYDGWSNGIILREFFQTYDALSRGDESLPLPPPVKTKFKEYVKWVMEQDKDKQKEYWVDYLKGIEGGTRFPAVSNNREHSPNNLFHAVFPKGITRQLQAFVKENRLTTASLLFGAWGILLQRYTGNDDVLFGTTVSGRSAKIEDIENMVGLFIQTPPLRVMSRPGERVIHLLHRIKETLRRREAYECTPLVDINTYSRVAHDEELFNTIVVIENYPLDSGLVRENTNHRLTLQSYSLASHTNYDLAIGIVMRDDDIGVTFNWQPQLIDRKSVKSLRTHFTRVIESMAANPGKQVEQIDILGSEEKKRLLYDFNDTTVIYPGNKLIHELFEEQAERIPDHIAVVAQGAGGCAITYEELNRSANQLAVQLRLAGVKADTIVGISLGSSIERVVAMMAILKAGGAYLPLDPDLPLNRMAAMLEDCQAPILIASTTTVGNRSFTLLKNLGQVRSGPRLTGIRAQLTDLDNLPIPDRSLVDYDRYMNKTGQAWVKHSLAIFATRGCPYKCAYCHKIWPKKHVVRSAEHIFAEVKLYYDMGVRRFVIIDDIFNMNVKNSKKFFQLILENKLKAQLFFPNGLRGDLLTKDYIDLMVRAGVVGAALALETASPRLQKLVGKNLRLEKFRENLVYLCETYPRVITELFTMIGFPTETEEEAIMTLDFVKHIKGIHFPYINIVRIYSNTDMHRMAVENGVSARAIFDSENLYFHELPDTLPFSKNFTLKLQTDFLNDYFLSKERLLHVLPFQMKVLTEEELAQKYNSYLAAEMNHFAGLLQFVGIREDELTAKIKRVKGEGIGFLDEAEVKVPGLNEKIAAYFHFPGKKPGKDALRILFLDLSQFFSKETDRLDIVFDPPLGMMAVISYMEQRLGGRVNGRVVKSRIDFDDFTGLQALLKEFQPEIIGLRTLTYYRDFFHQTAALIRQWGFDVPIVTGGPYATGNFNTILQDRNIDLVVLGEGEVTFSELIEKMLDNDKQLPGEEVLKQIPGLAFIPGRPNGLAGKDSMKAQANVSSREVILLDAIRETLSGNPKTDLTPVNKPHHAAYIMFTSGSTGKPKGVIIQHKNVINNLHWFGKTFAIGPGSNLLQMSDYTFDPSVEDIFGSLVHGGSLYLSDKDLILDRKRFRRFITDNDIHIIDHVPAMLDELLSTGERLRSLRAVITGGMRLEEEVKDRLIKKGYPLYNNYGPTEVTVDALCGLCSPEPVTLGRPIFNTKCYIFDSHNRLVPVGVTGELCAAGDGVSRGYLNNPGLTNDKFLIINNKKLLRGVQGGSFLEKSPPGRRRQKIYRTGDLARWLPDGNIQFFGRIDRQVKIRGNRVEPGEIEAQLRQHEGIKDALVRAVGQEGEISLCAYLVPVFLEALTTSQLKEYLPVRLPDYMVPSYFVLMEAFPLTPGGKVDIQALPVPGKKAGDKFDYAPPRNKTEEKLVGIWSEILGMPSLDIGIDDDFFKLGGHSIKATQLISKVHKEMNVRVSITELFERPTIKGLAEYMNRAEENRFSSIQPIEEREYYPVSSAQKRMFIANRFKGKDISDNATDVLVVEGDLDTRWFEAVMKQLVNRHQSLRTSFQIINDKLVQRVHAPGNVELAVEYEDSFDSHPIDIYDFLDDFIQPFDLGKAPLIRVALIKLTNRRHLVVMDVHHIIWDGGSKVAIMRELEDLHQGRQLPGPRLQYRDFSSWQNRVLKSDVIKKQEYWTGVFAGDIPVLHLPTDYPRPRVRSFAGDSVEIPLSLQLCEKVDRLVRETGATHFMVLLSVFYILLSRCSGQEDIIVGSPIVGRPHADLEKIVGMFVNMLALRNFPGGEKKFIEFLEEVKNSCSSAYENQDYQFDALVEKLGIPPDPARSALFDVVFAHHNRDAGDLPGNQARGEKIHEVTFKSYEYKDRKAQFDIVFYVYVGEGITLDFRYCKKLFKPLTAERMVNRYNEILRQVTGNPGIRLKEINISFDLLAVQSKAVDQVEFGF